MYGYSGRECYYPKRVQADFAYFAALLAPKAAEPEYQTIRDYISWVCSRFQTDVSSFPSPFAVDLC